MEEIGRHNWPLYKKLYAVWREGGRAQVYVRLQDYWARVVRLGFRGCAAFLLKERIWRLVSSRAGSEKPIYKLYAKTSAHPLFCRYSSSDREVFWSIFGHDAYACIDSVPEPKLIIDGGANVGYSAAYLLTRFPATHVIAVEPEDGNFAMMERNLAPFKERVTLIKAGIWSHTTGLVVCRGTYRDGKEWSTQVRECRAEETADIEAVDIGTLLNKVGWTGQILDVLKLDIEQAEAIVFSANYQSWINNVRTFAIELHDEHCEEVFYQALQGGDFTFSKVGDMTVAKRCDLPER